MGKWLKKVAAAVKAGSLMVLAFAPAMMASGLVWADGDNKPETTILPDDLGIEGLLKLVLDIVVYGLGVAAVLGVMIAGVMYMTARDNETQVARAKTRLYEVVIGLIAWAVMYVVLKWLVPGALPV